MAYVVVFVIGFLFGAYVIFFDHKDKVKKNLVPYILSDGSLQWREPPNTGCTGLATPDSDGGAAQNASR